MSVMNQAYSNVYSFLHKAIQSKARAAKAGEQEKMRLLDIDDPMRLELEIKIIEENRAEQTAFGWYGIYMPNRNYPDFLEKL